MHFPKFAARVPDFRAIGSRLTNVPLAALLAAIPTVGITSAQLPPGNWQYAWGDDFSGRSVATTKWQIASPGWTMPNSLSVATADKVKVTDGILSLEATRTGTTGNPQFSAGSVSTYQRRNFNGGYIEARILLPDTPGSWPAFWGLYDGWPPEMDIMEYPIDTAAGNGYSQDEYHTAFHYTNPGGSAAAGAGKVNPGNAGDLGGSYHHFAALWTANSSVRFFFDGVEVSSFYNAAEVGEMASMYLILDYAVGGWPGTPSTGEWPVGFTDQTKIDWVRVWTSGTSKTSHWNHSGIGDQVSWDAAANWTNGIPDSSGVIAGFGSVPASQQHIDWSGTRALSVIQLDGGTRYRFGWPDDRLLLGFGNSGAIQPAINLAGSTASEQEVRAELEWSGTLGINNDSAHPLLLTGRVQGGDGIAINGPGVVSFDGDSNSYNTTIIDSGGQGPGIARARGKNALGYGEIIIGEQGNGTTGRLELENGADLPNTVRLSGRNNDSPAVVNNSGSNSISGRISIQSGGDRYWIQSDSGELEISGNGRSAAGVAIDSSAGGSRTLTLKGAGAGVVSGSIQNGNAASLNLVKTDSGTWSLDGDNSYSGTTTVSAGLLTVNGTTGSGSTTLTNGSMLGGSGRVRSNLVAQTGATVRPGAEGFRLIPPSTPFSLLDDFDGYAPGPTTVATGGEWSGVFTGTGNSNIISSDGGLGLQTKGGAAWRGGEADISLRNAGIGMGEISTVFYRMKALGTGFFDIMTGLSPEVSNIDEINAWQDFAVMPFVNGTAGSNLAYKMTDAGLPGDVIFTMNTNVWYNVWLVINNSTQTYSVYWSTGTRDGTFGGTAATYRNGFTNAALNALGFMAGGDPTTSLLVDDIFVADGVQTQNPIPFRDAPLEPEPGILTIDNDCTLAAGSTLELDVSTGGLQDRLIVGGALNAIGSLKVTLDPAQPAPGLGENVILFDSNGGIVRFSSVDLPPLPAGLAWDITGVDSGVLSVAADLKTYEGWLLVQSLDPETDDPELDPDQDGIPNAFEWLFDSDPQVADGSVLPTASLKSHESISFPGADPTKSYLSIEAIIRKETSGMALIAQASGDLATIDDASSSQSIVSILLEDLGDFERREWIYTVPREHEDSGFIRLKMIGN